MNGEAAGSIRVVFPTNKITDFSYDAEKGGYTSTQWNSAYTDGNTGESVVFENVLVLYSPTSTGIDEKNHSAIYTYDYQDAGYFFNGGYAEPITEPRQRERAVPLLYLRRQRAAARRRQNVYRVRLRVLRRGELFVTGVH